MADEKIILGQNKQAAQAQQVPNELIDNEFQVPTDDVDLPSKGVFYPNGKKT